MSRILIVDDEENVRGELAHALRMEGYDVLEAADGNEALRTLKRQQIELVVADIIMPHREGLETIMEIRMNWPAIKIIAISGGGRTKNTEFLDVASKLGADSVLEKPFSLVKLKNKVAEAINDGPRTVQ